MVLARGCSEGITRRPFFVVLLGLQKVEKGSYVAGSYLCLSECGEIEYDDEDGQQGGHGT